MKPGMYIVCEYGGLHELVSKSSVRFMLRSSGGSWPLVGGFVVLASNIELRGEPPLGLVWVLQEEPATQNKA